MAKRPIYIAIMVAADAGVGMRLTAKEVLELSMDSAIEDRASAELEDDEEHATSAAFNWTAALRRIMKARGNG